MSHSYNQILGPVHVLILLINSVQQTELVANIYKHASTKYSKITVVFGCMKHF